MAEAGTEQQLKALANLLLLQQRLREAQNPAELGFVLVNDTQVLVPYRSGLLWVVGKTDADRGTITSVSGAVDHDEHSPFMSWMKALCQVLAKTGDTAMTEYKKGDLPEEIASQWDVHGAEYLLWCPLRSGSGVRHGALLLWREQPIAESEQRILGNWVAAASYSLAALKGKPFARAHFQWTRRRKQLVAGIGMLVLLLLFLPVHLSVLAQAEIVARDPLVVRSPMDGIVASLHVRPNMVVADGTVLLKLDDTELQTRLDVAEQTLAISRAQYQQAGQAAAFDNDAKASLRVLALEAEKRQSEVTYVKSLLERGEVKTEQAGVVVMPNPDELVGRPVVTGERLMTIADPENTQLEAWLSVGDDISLLYDATIEFFPNVAPDKKFSARLRRMDYRAETTESGELAYRIRGDFGNQASLPRIGMRGTAKLYGERVSLAYYLSRRPLATMRRWLGL
jgi:hypothetical protein